MDYPVKIVDQAGRHLRALRKRLRLSQEMMGLRLGVSQGRVAQIENNVATVSFEQVLRCVQALEAELIIRTPELKDESLRPMSKERIAQRRQWEEAMAKALGVSAEQVRNAADQVGARQTSRGSILFSPRKAGSW